MFISQYCFTEYFIDALNRKDKESMGKLIEWCERYGNSYWNGEVYALDGKTGLKPSYAYDEENEEYVLIDWEFVNL